MFDGSSWPLPVGIVPILVGRFALDCRPFFFSSELVQATHADPSAASKADILMLDRRGLARRTGTIPLERNGLGPAPWHSLNGFD
ncbi:MAG: hypothetical protein JWR25_1100 [Noviherbaspirillum sp.]|jgi:hypothetical protein|nr:hypothetical protein [Noviherbaspirillum sp.]